MQPIAKTTITTALLLAFLHGAQAADSLQVKVPSGDGVLELDAESEGENAAAQLNGVTAKVNGGDTEVSNGTDAIKVEGGSDGSAKTLSCDAARDHLKLTGQGSSLDVKGACKLVEVATTGAAVHIASAEAIVISGTGNQVTADRLGSGKITGTGNMLQWAEGLRGGQKPKLDGGNATNSIQQME